MFYLHYYILALAFTLLFLLTANSIYRTKHTHHQLICFIVLLTVFYANFGYFLSFVPPLKTLLQLGSVVFFSYYVLKLKFSHSIFSTIIYTLLHLFGELLFFFIFINSLSAFEIDNEIDLLMSMVVAVVTSTVVLSLNFLYRKIKAMDYTSNGLKLQHIIYILFHGLLLIFSIVTYQMKIRHLLVDDEVITTYLLLIAISSFASLLYSFMYSANKHETLKIKELNSKLFELAAIDGMTGIFNRTTGLKRLEEVIEKIKESKDQLSLCFIDVDNLKQVNDCYGHQEGDRLIVTLIDLIKKHLNQEDIFLRLGGDEFLIGFPGYNKEMTQEKLCIIEKTISDFNLNKTYPYNVSASYGIIVLDPTVYDLSLGDLINLADFNMYEKKMAK